MSISLQDAKVVATAASVLYAPCLLDHHAQQERPHSQIHLVEVVQQFHRRENFYVFVLTVNTSSTATIGETSVYDFITFRS